MFNVICLKYQKHIFKCSIKLKMNANFLKVKNIFSKLISRADLQFLSYLIFFYHYLLSFLYVFQLLQSGMALILKFLSYICPITLFSFLVYVFIFSVWLYVRYKNQFNTHCFSFKVTMCCNI